MVNNKDLIIPLLEFPHKDIFYFVQILQRKKDHKNQLGNNSRLIKAYFIDSLGKLELQWDEMVKLAEVFEARIMINLNPRNYQKAGFHLLQKVANQMANNDFHSIYKAYTSVCGEYHSEIDKRWVIDLDKHQLDLKHDIMTFIYESQNKLKNHNKASNYTILAKIPSLSGLHIITNPFNLSDWKWKDVEIHKNNPTNMYIP